ncbi:hypothetical protein NFI96_004921 [Prochilodus magdalenae]|nr:hypothetical protein NFI96_004921 [Prochilodus magdalenae]
MEMMEWLHSGEQRTTTAYHSTYRRVSTAALLLH